MYYISSLIGRINYGFFRVTNVVTGPFRSLFYGAKSLTRFNPFRSRRTSFYPVETRIRSILRLPSQAPTANRPSLSSEARREVRQNRWRSRSRARVTQRAQYSQIHLIRTETDERTVVHIGTIIGRSASEIILEPPGQRPVQLRFSQVDPQEHQAPMLLTYLVGEAVLKVNGVEIEHESPLVDGAVIRIDDHEYICQLYAWDKAPIVTRVDAGWATDIGPKRDENQDAIGIYQHSDAYLFAIADGVGKGEYGGQVSEFAIRYLLAAFQQNVKYRLKWTDILEKTFKYINAEVRHFARHSPSSEGTTLTAVVIKGMEAHVAHVGDSRLYQWHDGSLEQVTRDHIGQVPVEQETRIANESLEPPQMRSVLMKAIGKADSIQPDIFSVPLQPGDRLLLCSDGLTGVVPDAEIMKVFPTLRAGWLAGKLIQMAVERDTKDNITAISIDVLKDAFVEDAWLAENEPRIYAGFNRSWPMHLDRPKELYTDYPLVSRRGCWVTLGALVVIAILFFALRSGGNGSASAQSLDTPTASPTASATLTETVQASSTPNEPPASSTPVIPPTATIIRVLPTPTPALPPTPIPPTSTLRASAFNALEREADI